MNPALTRILALGGALFMVVGALWLTFESFRHIERAAEAPPVRQARYELRGAEWTRYDAQGAAQLHATADTIRYYDDKSAELDHLNVDRLGSTPGPWHLTSPHGIVPAREQRVQLTEPVNMRGALRDGEPLTVTATTMWVDLKTREVYTDSPVTVTGEFRSMEALGMRADWAGTRIKLLNDVTVRYEPRG